MYIDEDNEVCEDPETKPVSTDAGNRPMLGM